MVNGPGTCLFQEQPHASPSLRPREAKHQSMCLRGARLIRERISRTFHASQEGMRVSSTQKYLAHRPGTHVEPHTESQGKLSLAE